MKKIMMVFVALVVLSVGTLVVMFNQVENASAVSESKVTQEMKEKQIVKEFGFPNEKPIDVNIYKDKAVIVYEKDVLVIDTTGNNAWGYDGMDKGVWFQQ
ncbi:hypothetical protein FK481_0068 [Listeria phage LP-010]|uniref:Uncharacterized protein n=2 Tax=Homburgvirus LP114 TaxID=1921129 RepID=A0A514U6J9_9CAUD|nr:hypothetical protein FK481_0068 [Listeria phage LP-010]QDK04691.1 hypothetical protein FK482_0069 [Listeria phage LP-013]